MSNRNNSNWFFLGLGLGAFIGYLVNTDEGRKARQEASYRAGEISKEVGQRAGEISKEVGQRANELSKEVGTQAQQALKTAGTQLDSALQSGKKIIDDASTTVQNKLYAAGDKLEETENDFQKGLEKARKEIKSKTNA